MNGNVKITMAAILHEMLHTLGFFHEQQRFDRSIHNIDSINKDDVDNKIMDASESICLGQYDYQSIMHYRINCHSGIKSSNRELNEYAGKSTNFSEGDLAAIRKIYGGSNAHFGIWHFPCTSLGNNLKCAFINGSNKIGHWTCCFKQNQNDLQCGVKHTNYYHLKHSRKDCQPKKCLCNSCGIGCIYQGTQGHWSCCLEEKKDCKECKMDPYKIVPRLPELVPRLPEIVPNNNKKHKESCVLL